MKRVASALVVLVLASASDAHAQESGRRAPSIDRPYVLVGLNPIKAPFGDYSFDAIVLPTPELALVGSFHYVSSTEPKDDDDQRPATQFHGMGGELGARYYPHWHHGIGEFMGASLMYGQYGSGNTGCCAVAASDHQTAMGLAIDGGVTLMLRPFFVTIGLGVQYVIVTPRGQVGPSDLLGISVSDILYGSGVRPRVLLTFGFGG